MSKEQLNDPTRKWYLTAENISTSTTGSNLTLEASANIYLLSGTGTGTIGSIYFNNNAWFDSSANLNFSFGEGTYENVVHTSTTVPSSPLTNNDLFKTYSFDPSFNQTIHLPLPTTCKIGSWININNFSSTNTITVQDSSGSIVYIILAPSTSGTIGGSGVKMLAVSSSGKTGDVGVFAENWICTQSGVTSYTDTNGNVVDLSSYAATDSPNFTGTPLAPTPVATDNSTKIATTEWVNNQGYLTSVETPDLSSYAPKESPTFTGTPLAPTPTSIYDNSNKVASTEWVQNLINSLTTGTKISQYIIAYANKLVSFYITPSYNIIGKNYYTYNLFSDGVSFGEYFVSSSGAVGILSGYGWNDGIWKASTEGRYYVEVKFDIEYNSVL
jgi:hypothetical protein